MTKRKQQYLSFLGGLCLSLGAIPVSWNFLPSELGIAIGIIITISGALLMTLSSSIIFCDIKRVIRNAFYWKRVEWTFGNPHYLAMSKSGHEPIRVIGFQATGKNRTGKRINKFEAHLTSLTNGKVYPFKIIINGMPFDFDDTNEIPENSNFHISARFKDGEHGDENWLTDDQFIKEVGGVEISAMCNGKLYRKKFSSKDVRSSIERWREEISPDPPPHVSPKSRK